MQNICFGRLCQGDCEAMADLERECFSLPWTAAQCQSALGQKSFAAFGIWDGADLKAYISLFHIEQEMEIINVAVRRECRRMGLGSRILSLVLQAAGKMGMQKAVLEVRGSNRPAIALYEKLGFGYCGKRDRYYPDTGEDALIYVYNFDRENI